RHAQGVEADLGGAGARILAQETQGHRSTGRNPDRGGRIDPALHHHLDGAIGRGRDRARARAPEPPDDEGDGSEPREIDQRVDHDAFASSGTRASSALVPGSRIGRSAPAGAAAPAAGLRKKRRRLALLTTVTDEAAIAAPAIIGLSSTPSAG